MLERVNCNLCGANHYKILYKGKSRRYVGTYLITQSEAISSERIVKCLRCGLIYMNPRRTARQLLTAYRNMVDSDYVKEETGRRISARTVLKKLRRYKKRESRLLEIGCAAGFLLDEARKAGWDVYGLEISKWAVDYARERFSLNVLCSTLKKTNFPPGYFDVIVLSDTIEHLTDPKGTLFQIRPLLSPRGVLYLNTPDIGSLISRALKAGWWGINQFHLYYFTRRTLRQLLQAAGFEVIRWGMYPRTFSLSYWLKRVEGYDKKIFNLLKWMIRLRLIGNRLVKVNLGDQIEIIARRKHKMVYLPELERDEMRKKKGKMKVIVVLPAYNAARTLPQTVEDIPKDVVDEIILVDDASQDRTVEIAKRLGLIVFRHNKNKGYGANQKTCYTKALERGADIVVMVHPDYQYDPKAIQEMLVPIQAGRADAVFGSRMLKRGALEGGMPLWKHNANIIFTAFANVILGTYLTEYHSGFRAYSANLLRSVRFMDNSDSFIFDTEIIIQILVHYFKIEEVPIRTRYFEEASVISLWAGFWYGLNIFKVLFKYMLHKSNIIRCKQFE